MVTINTEQITARHGHPSHGPVLARKDLSRLRMLLIDDDVAYGALMVKVAESQGIRLDFFPSLTAAGSVGALGQYDAAILDFFLDRFTGAEIAEYIDAFFASIPVMVVSGKESYPEGQPRPKCVKSFLCKSNGPVKILTEARGLILEKENQAL
jgi:CheY-like chemotaxis protein